MSPILLAPGQSYERKGFLAYSRVYFGTFDPELGDMVQGGVSIHQFKAIMKKNPSHPDSLEFCLDGDVHWEVVNGSPKLSGSNYMLMQGLGGNVYAISEKHMNFQKSLAHSAGKSNLVIPTTIHPIHQNGRSAYLIEVDASIFEAEEKDCLMKYLVKWTESIGIKMGSRKIIDDFQAKMLGPNKLSQNK